MPPTTVQASKQCANIVQIENWSTVAGVADRVDCCTRRRHVAGVFERLLSIEPDEVRVLAAWSYVAEVPPYGISAQLWPAEPH